MPVRHAALALAALGLLIAAAPEGGATYRLGDARVTSLLDGRAPFPAGLFQGVPAAEVTTLLRAGAEALEQPGGETAWKGSVWAFLVETGGRRVLVDTGAGGGMPGMGGAGAALAAAKVHPASIDAIAISHMHGDHVGGLVDAAGKPRFAKATLHLHRLEAGHWGDPANAAAAPAGERGMYDQARAILAAYGDRVRLFDGPGEIVPGLAAEPLVGHTPGHTVYRLKGGGREMVFIGDMIHSLAVQMPRPEATLGFDSNAAQARAARAAFLKANADGKRWFAGPHFLPGVVTIKADGAGYRATPAMP